MMLAVAVKLFAAVLIFFQMSSVPRLFLRTSKAALFILNNVHNKAVIFDSVISYREV